MKKIISILFILSGILLAQSSDMKENSSLFRERESFDYKGSMEQLYKNRTFLRSVVPQVLEKEVNEEEYIVGPGDMFLINVFGQFENEYEAVIAPDGTVVIPSLGQIDLKGLNLKAAKQKILQKIQKMYLDIKASVSFYGMKKFRVYLTGAVFSPGTYFVQGTDRVSDVLDLSGGPKNWSDETKIEIRHLDNTRDTVNLSLFYLQADKKNNPMLHSGDMIFVPIVDLSKPYIVVENKTELAVKRTTFVSHIPENKSTIKYFSLVEGETLALFMRRISAYNSVIDLSGLVLLRDGKRINIDLENHYEEFSAFQMHSKDRLIIPEINTYVYVQGDVRIPGAYPYNVNLTANDYIGRAGVLERAKSSDYVMVVRPGTNEVLTGGDVQVKKGDTIIVPRKSRAIIRDYIGIIIPVASILLSTYSIYSR